MALDTELITTHEVHKVKLLKLSCLEERISSVRENITENLGI